MEISRCKIPRSSTYTTSEKTIRFWHLDYNPNQAQKLISSSMSQHMSTRNISSKSTHLFLSNLANRQTDRQTDRQTNTGKTFTSSFVGGNNNFFCHIESEYVCVCLWECTCLSVYLPYHSLAAVPLRPPENHTWAANTHKHATVITQVTHDWLLYNDARWQDRTSRNFK